MTTKPHPIPTGTAEVVVTPSSVTDLTEIDHQAREYLRQAKAANTLRAYASDWADFSAWCQRRGRVALPAVPETVAYYLTDLSRGRRVSTLGRRLAAITQVHRVAGLESPCASAQVRLVWSGIRRERGVAQAHMRPVLTAHLRAMVAGLPDSLLGDRDRALLLLGFAGAMRRSELVGLDATDLEPAEQGLVVVVRRSKTDPFGSGRKLGVPRGARAGTCPVRALQAWRERASIVDGPLFRPVDRHGHVRPTRLSDRAVAEVVKRSLGAAGIDPERFAGHSLRAGLITQAAIEGASERSIQEQSGHRSLLVMRRYIRDGSLFRENAAAKVGL